MYHRKCFTRDKRFSCSDHKTVNEKDPVVSICFADSCKLKWTKVQWWMFDKPGLYTTPYSTWHANAAILQNYFNEMLKNCYLHKTRAVEILHYTVRPSCDAIGIGILSVNTAHKILL